MDAEGGEVGDFGDDALEGAETGGGRRWDVGFGGFGGLVVWEFGGDGWDGAAASTWWGGDITVGMFGRLRGGRICTGEKLRGGRGLEE